MITEQELFGVLVRIIGFGLLVYGAYVVIWGFTLIYMPHYASQCDEDKDDKTSVKSGGYFYFAWIFILMGVFIIAAADMITPLAYMR